MEKYIHYSIEELVVEESFIHWVKQSDAKAIAFWDHWLKANPSQESKINRAKEIVEKIKFKTETGNKERADRIWNEIDKQTSEPKKVHNAKTSTKRRNLLPWVGVAAGLLALYYIMVGGNTQMNITTSIAQIETVELPDGSVVNLNAASTLKYDPDDFKNQRVLDLKGEAFFNVQKGSSFIVKTPNGEVEVLGTSFNVYSRNALLNVNCESGKVAVRSGVDMTILERNEKVKIAQNKVHIKSIEKSVSRSDWKNGIYHYDNTDLRLIMEDIKRQWDVKVNIQKGLEEIKFTGSFKTDHIENAIAEVCWPLGVKYVLKDKEIKIFKD